MSRSKAILALDVGEKRIGVAMADGDVRIARPLGAVSVDGSEFDVIRRYCDEEKIELIIIGYPRNQSGEATAQTAYVERFKESLETNVSVPVVFRDESLTSVLAEQRLQSHGKPYTKGDIDAYAAVLILEDYLEA